MGGCRPPDDDDARLPKDDDAPPSGAVRCRSTSTAAAIVVPLGVVVTEWLERRKMKVPDALLGVDDDDGGESPPSSSPSSFESVDDVLRLLPDLRERERRALVRHVERTMARRRATNERGGGGGGSGGDHRGSEGDDADGEVRLGGSDGEYDVGDVGGGGARDAITGGVAGWPTDVEFSNEYRWDAGVTPDLRERYCPTSPRRRAPRRSGRVYFKRIVDPDHPACGQYGLFCALDRAPPGTWLLDYVGHVTSGEDQDKSSDYLCDFGDSSELACDASDYGNESRFVNDFRNTGRHPNVEFNLRRDSRGELRQGVYVKPANESREGKGFDGVERDEELLVSYGKGYWRSRVGNLTDFVWRLPGRPMPESGRPSSKENATTDENVKHYLH